MWGQVKRSGAGTEEVVVVGLCDSASLCSCCSSDPRVPLPVLVQEVRDRGVQWVPH